MAVRFRPYYTPGIVFAFEDASSSLRGDVRVVPVANAATNFFGE
jgi:hypothetical protein